MKRFLLAFTTIVCVGLGLAIAQNINRSVQLSQSPLGPIGMDTVNGVYFPAKLNTAGNAPTISSFGTGAAIVGSDMAGRVQLGTTPGSQGTITWRTAYTSSPYCVANPEITTATQASGVGIVASANGMLVNFNMLAGGAFSYICIGRSTG